MKAVDTNILVRLIAEDDEQQHGLALRAVGAGIFASSGVLIETEWVLRSGYGWLPPRIAAAIRELLKTGKVSVADPEALQWAIDRYAAGADWADMLHLIDSRRSEAFLTFDRALARAAGETPPVPVQVLR